MFMQRVSDLSSTTKLSICLVSDDFLPSATGVGAHLQVVAAELAKRGHRVSMITTRRPDQIEFEVWKGVEIFRTFTIKIAGFYQAVPSKATIENIFRKVQPDLVHFHYLGFLLLRSMKIAKEFGLPTVYTYHMSEEHLTQPFFMRPFRSLIAKKIVRCCNKIDQVISVSQKLAIQLPQKGIKTPIQYISNPVIFTDKIAEQTIIKKSSFDVFFAGRLDPEKNIPYLLKGFKKLLETHPDAFLRIAGKGTQKLNLENLVREMGIENKVQFLGFLTHDELSHYYASCDIFVLPSIFETQGLVAMEAMWFSKPIIVTNRIVSAEELVEHEINGFIVDAGSVADLTARMITLAVDQDLRVRMGGAGRKRANEYRPEIVMDELENVYRQVNTKHTKSIYQSEKRIKGFLPSRVESINFYPKQEV
jgi:glycosyltransferase involved in cell wall biosynthesis